MSGLYDESNPAIRKELERRAEAADDSLAQLRYLLMMVESYENRLRRAELALRYARSDYERREAADKCDRLDSKIGETWQAIYAEFPEDVVDAYLEAHPPRNRDRRY